MPGTLDILARKRDGRELTWKDLEHMVKGGLAGKVREAQLGALLMACHVRGMSDDEVERLMRVMMFSGEILVWPTFYVNQMASLQSTGSTGNKAKLILAPAMAACGLTFPILSSRGRDIWGGILNKLSTIPGFSGSDKTLNDIHVLLANVGCCVVQQPDQVAPAERLIRDIAGVSSVGHNNAFKEACMIARVGALKLKSIVMDIPYGPGETTKTKEAAQDMARILVKLSEAMKIKCHVVITKVVHPVGHMFGQSLEVAEAVKCLHGEGSGQLNELVCRLGGHILREAGVVGDLCQGEVLVAEKLRDGSARKKFGEMLFAQGVDRADVRMLLRKRRGNDHIWSVLPNAHYVTHLSAPGHGYIHHVDLAVLNEVMYELVQATISSNDLCAGGCELIAQVGSHIKAGDLWAKMYHNTRMTGDQAERLKFVLILKDEAPVADHLAVEIDEMTSQVIAELARAKAERSDGQAGAIPRDTRPDSHTVVENRATKTQGDSDRPEPGGNGTDGQVGAQDMDNGTPGNPEEIMKTNYDANKSHVAEVHNLGRKDESESVQDDESMEAVTKVDLNRNVTGGERIGSKIDGEGEEDTRYQCW